MIVKFYRVLVYDVCFECRRRVDYDLLMDIWICFEYGLVNFVKIMVFDFGLDDLMGYIRIIFFGDFVVELIGEELEVIDEKFKKFIDEGLILKEVGKRFVEDEYYLFIGKEIVVRGSVVEDKFFGIFFKVRSWDEVNEKVEIECVRREFYCELKEYGFE